MNKEGDSLMVSYMTYLPFTSFHPYAKLSGIAEESHTTTCLLQH